MAVSCFSDQHLVEAAPSGGHQVALCNRGKSNPELFPGVKEINGGPDGDRAAIAEALATDAWEAGLTFRPLEETIWDTLAWAEERREEHRWRAGLQRKREKAVLEAWDEVTQ